MGIVLCGLNGAGKSTLGKALAEKLNFYFIDIETLYFPKTESDYKYAFPRSYEEVKNLLLQEIEMHENFVFASVKGDYGEKFYPLIQFVAVLDVPKHIRLQRIKQRSFQKFGSRISEGGDLAEAELNFFRYVESRDEKTVENWIKSLKCPIMRLDGTKSVSENLNLILKYMQNENLLTEV